MNSICLVGRLGRDPEVRFTQSGTAVGSLRLAVTGRKKKADGSWGDSTMWIDVVVFEKQAENASQYLHKGDEVGVTGRLELEEWEDKQGGKRSVHKVFASQLDYLRKNAGPGIANGNSRASPARSAAQIPTTGDDSGGFIDDDLPF